MTSSDPISFYDIASGPPRRTFAPNPWKTRYALNFKNVSYKTEWVELPDVTSVRKRLEVPPNRTLPDGSPFYTLPIIHDPSTSETVGDTFEIALYLDKTYPDGPRLIPDAAKALIFCFNAQVDAIFTGAVQLFLKGMPLNPETAELTQSTMAARVGAPSWESLYLLGAEREEMFKKFEEALGTLAKGYGLVKGLFLDGEEASYADLIVGGWLAYARSTLSSEEWERVKGWHEGLWGRIDAALEKWAVVK